MLDRQRRIRAAHGVRSRHYARAMKLPLLLAATASLLAAKGVDPTPAPPLKVFLLAGQSNMVGAGIVPARRNEGRGSLERLVRDEETRDRFAHLVDAEGAWIQREDVLVTFRGGREVDGPLGPGFGGAEDQIGPELGFGTVVGDHFDEPVLLIKIAWGGKSKIGRAHV